MFSFQQLLSFSTDYFICFLCFLNSYELFFMFMFLGSIHLTLNVIELYVFNFFCFFVMCDESLPKALKNCFQIHFVQIWVFFLSSFLFLSF